MPMPIDLDAPTARPPAREATLPELRGLRRRSQEKVAETLGIRQSAVSKLERRPDMYVATLRRFVEALGGRLELVARFPDQPPVRIAQTPPSE